ncbi:hypothetical protein ACOMHN_013141 [Nucella lapillus]
MADQQQQHRRRRRLPYVQRTGRSRPLTYWPSYKGGVDWLRRHHGILDTALGLLEIYPNLIQDRSMDVMWEFISPFFTSPYAKNAPTVKNRPRELYTIGSSVSRNSRQNKPGTSPHLNDNSPRAATKPMAMTYPINSSASAHASKQLDTPHQGSGDSSSSSRRTASSRGDTQDLLPLISVTCSQDQPEPELQALFDDEDCPQSDPGLPCVYVCCPCQYHEEACGDKLPQHVLHALQHQFYVRTGPCFGENDTDDFGSDQLSETDIYVFVLGESSLNSPACLKRLYALWCLNIPSVFVKDSNYCLPSPMPDAILRCIHALESSEMPLMSSAKTFPTSRSTTPRCGLTIPTTTTSSDPRHQRQQGRGKNGQDSDFMLYLLNGYRTALIFEKNSLDDCENLLKENIQFLVGTEQSQTGSIQSSTTSSTKTSSHSCSNEILSVQQLSDNQSRLMTNSLLDISPRKEAESYELTDKKDGLLDRRWKSAPGEIHLHVSAFSDSSSSSTPATAHLLSVASFNASSHANRRLGSPPPVKMTTTSSVPMVGNPSLPPVKSPAGKRHHLDPFSHLPHFQQH